MMNMRTAACGFLTAVAVAWSAPPAQAQFVQGNFNFQFADPTTGAPISTLLIPAVGGSAKVSLYLIQTGGLPVNLVQLRGAEGLGVRLNYANPSGIIKVPTTAAANITARPPPTFNPNGVSSDYDFIQRTGTATGADTTLSASITEGLIDPTDPLPFPGTEDPLGNKLRMLIGTFNLQGLVGGTEIVTAVHPASGTQNLSGPNPTITGLRNDGTTGPLPGNGAQGEILIDQFLAAVAPTLTVTVAVPEPSTFALGSLAAFGLAAWRRRRATAAVAA